MNTAEKVAAARALFENPLTFALSGAQVCELALGVLDGLADSLDDGGETAHFIIDNSDLLDAGDTRRSAISYWPAQV